MVMRHFLTHSDAHIRIYEIPRKYARIFAVGSFFRTRMAIPSPDGYPAILATESKTIECPKTLQLTALHQKFPYSMQCTKR